MGFLLLRKPLFTEFKFAENNWIIFVYEKFAKITQYYDCLCQHNKTQSHLGKESQ